MAALALAALLPMALPIPAKGAEKPPDAQARRREVQEERARNAAKVNVLQASEAELGEALDLLDANVRAQEARAASARQAAEAADEAAAAAAELEKQTSAQLATLRGSMKRVAVDAYVRGPSYEAMLPVDAKSFSQLATKQFLLDVAVGKGTELADKLRSTSEDLRAQRSMAENARQVAASRRNEVEGRLSQVKQALEVKQTVAESVEGRLERALAEADSLAALDKQLAAEIARRQSALASRIASTARSSRASRSAPRPTGAVGIASVRGISVASAIAARFEEMLAAAEGDGFTISGSGYRNSDGQIATRRSNCGSSNYDVYEKPSYQCSPPTARPGTSMHEQGLAVDLTWNGGLIASRSAVFQWLLRNAVRFGLFNLPGEPWHWSTTGN